MHIAIVMDKSKQFLIFPESQVSRFVVISRTQNATEKFYTIPDAFFETLRFLLALTIAMCIFGPSKCQKQIQKLKNRSRYYIT